MSFAIASPRTSPSTGSAGITIGEPRGSVNQCPTASFLAANMERMNSRVPDSLRLTTTTRLPSHASATGSSGKRMTRRSLGAGSSDA